MSDHASAVRASAAVFDEIARIEKLMSPYKNESDIYKINSGAGRASVAVSRETYDLLVLSKKIGDESGGAFDPSFAALGGLWRYSDEKFIPPSATAVSKLLHLVNYKNIILEERGLTVMFAKNGMKIGLGGIAKGYAVKRGIEIMISSGIDSGIVEEGGDLQVIGTNNGKKWRCGLKHPRDNTMTAVFNMDDMDSVATSGDYERYADYRGRRYHHILDPATGFPAETFASVSVISKDPVISDACATALFVSGNKRSREFLKKRPDIGAVMIDLNMKIYATKNIRDKIKFFGDPAVDWID